MQRNILITGGAGVINSCLVWPLLTAEPGCCIWIVEAKLKHHAQCACEEFWIFGQGRQRNVER